MKKAKWIWVLITLSMVACNSEPPRLVEGGYDEAEMEAAMQRAVNEVDDFIAELKSGRADSYAVKAPVEENGQVEHFWLTGVSYDGDNFTGTIDNEPGIVSSVQLGQEYSIGKLDISDWMFIRDGLMYGNYTMRPMLELMPSAEAQAYREMFASP